MTIKIIDPHIHLFDRSLGDYHWLKPENPPFWSDKSVIQRDFSIDDLSQNLAKDDKLSLSGFVHIEAGFDNDKPWRELEYLENLSLDSLDNENIKIKPLRTIASIDLQASAEDFINTLKTLKQHHSLVGVRHILDEQAFDILSNQQAQQNFSYLNEISDFIFELQLPLAHKNTTTVIPLLTEIIASNSQLRFIINHAGFPPKKALTDINNEAWSLWQNNITKLAKFANVLIKCSGMEMIDRKYEMSWFSQVTSYCLEKFSVERVMLASNFPLCLLGREAGKKLGNKTYASYWLDIIESSVIKQCSEIEKSALLYNNALRIYRLKP